MIKVLRLGHRTGRDERVSTHVGLTARQWGADEIVYCGERDSSMMESLEDTIDRWGGAMDVRYEEDHESEIEEFDGKVVHLTMYGERIDDKEEELEKQFEGEDVMIVVGAEKVPREVYEVVDHNIGVGNQPHSEIAALAVFMDRFFGLKNNFKNANIKIEPSRNKKITSET